ncbi:tRNA (adenosine(37)-N6)-threonylcarbamoyltransferase complex dimerization subunit type 1 TsaB [Lichenihabitans sp. PAMC28606]|uniref:tRNA (adenosine(37)-N6)-threonylcarbamoyltransferase complex dimerization subunit type 1 TsaB n=1 Tax=Lichenihabitans sp. PAMC28606 TaxID=2880932 RepID=UPI001D09C91F|nr:tRNA (adenosine(37)-N6)-threonylcarbamoyltransferase complex dimerization subunit type 1 TsaB [Lichenihabitans sp. PAMC28606]UDL95844.1 tRNA (adenosine(37)-N6)-threonylcarbamoyltransferase complex dimerization subunit type 1 TsaB [Lichenihabitans sp. PAMC28606]
MTETAAVDETSPDLVLAIDTSLSAVSACVSRVGEPAPIAFESMAMARGHAEALVPLIDRVVSQIDGGFAALTRVAVTIGPGSFTGIRVGVAAARAIGLACKIPVVGVSTLSALAAPAIASGFRPTIVAAIDAHHGNVYVQSFSVDGGTQLGATILSVKEAIRAVGQGPIRLVGSGATMLAIEAWSLGINAEIDEKSMTPDIGFVARLGLLADPVRALPRPFYIRPPDAKPQTNGVIARVE